MVAPTTQSQPSRPPSAGMVGSLLGSLNVVGGDSVSSSLGSTLELEDGGMSVTTESYCEVELNGLESIR